MVDSLIGFITFAVFLFALGGLSWLVQKVFDFIRDVQGKPRIQEAESVNAPPEVIVESGSRRMITPQELELAEGSLNGWEPKMIFEIDFHKLESAGDFPVIPLLGKPKKCTRCSRIEIDTIDWGHWGPSTASLIDEYGELERLVARGCMVMGIQTHWECAHCGQGYRKNLPD